MKKIVSVLSLVLLTALVWTYEIPAASWDFIYECDKLPDDSALGDKVWEVFGTSGIGKITPDGELRITDPADKVGFFMRKVKDAKNTTVEARVKVLSQSGVAYTILLGIEDGVTYAWLDLFPDGIQIHGGETHKVDMTKYHILRMTRDGDNITIYVDDEKVMEGRPGEAGDRKNIIFGAGSTAGTGEHYWDYVVFTTAGAFSPKELPNFPSTQAVESKEKVAICWGMLKSR